MRKYLALVLSVIFILCFTATAFAIHETGEPVSAVGPAKITLGGKILVRGWYFDNVSYYAASAPYNYSFNLPESSDSQALYTTNAYLTVNAMIGDNVQGFMELETTAGGSGNPNTGLYIWGTYDTKPASDLFFRQLWVQYTGSGLLGAPSGIKAGHMLITLGEKQFLNNERFGNDAILLWVDPTKELHIAVGTTKLNEGYYNVHSDDVDGYIAVVTYMLDKKNTIGANYLLAHSDGNLPSEVSPPNCDSLNFQNVGLHANGDISGLTYAAEVDFQFGKAKDVGFSGTDAKFSGWGVFAKLGYMIDPINLRGSFAMGSGDDDYSDNKIKEFQTLQGPDQTGPLARFVHYTQIYERTISTTSQNSVVTTTLGGNTRNTGIANTIYYNLGIDVNPVKELSLSLDGFIIRATKNEFGSKNAGTEVDFKGTYKIAKNLNYFVEAGAFWPGKYYEDYFGIDKKTVTQAVHGLSLTF
ncbi:MAG: hypothetical protein A2Y97_08440 [Nitrospirae bacterium RBG_13_39_12]|nr:MAG: hypothetical protein A2Y97_08440 [Nitrospirae bacterium RBG_13_39_12]